MRIGVTLPSVGSLSQPDDLIKAAKEAERLGYDRFGLPTGFCIRFSPGPNIRSRPTAHCRTSTSVFWIPSRR